MTFLKNSRVRDEAENVSQTAQGAVRHARGAARHGAEAIREAAQPVRQDLKQLLRDVEQAASTLKHETGAEARAMRDSLQMRATELRAMAADKTQQARDKAHWYVDRTAKHVQASPLKAIGIAAAVGAILGLLCASSRHPQASRNHHVE